MSAESLIKNHAIYSKASRLIKSEMSAELDQCTHGDFSEVITEKDLIDNPNIYMGTCVNSAYYAKIIMDNENPDFYQFDEVLENFGCDHCIRYRKLKRDYGKIRTKLGQVRSAITKHGDRLNKNAGNS